jgi:hypothetical protein
MHTFNAYGGQVLHTGPGFSTGNFSDQDIAVALGRMRDNPAWMPGFLRHHRLTPAMVVTAINSANPEAADGEHWVRLFVDLYPQLLREWFNANPLPDAVA